MHDTLVIRAQNPAGSSLRIFAARLLDAKLGTTLVNLPAITDFMVGTELADLPVGKHRLALDVPGQPTLEFSVEIQGDGDRSFGFTPPTPTCATITGQQASAKAAHSQRLHVVNFTNPKSKDAVERRQNADSISILHVYAHIDALGRTHPGSVRQLHFFSHGYKCGPVLLNTYDNSGSDARDPTDKVRVQGESLTYSSADVIRELRRDTLPDSYMVQFCKTIGVDGWSAPPGVTSSYKRSSRRYYFFINEDVHGDVVAWYERYFARGPRSCPHPRLARTCSSPRSRRSLRRASKPRTPLVEFSECVERSLGSRSSS